MNKQELVSHHTFLLPFKWSKKGVKGIITTEGFEQAAGQYVSSDNWSTEDFTLDKIVAYNEFHYFYDYVREALYDYSGVANEDNRKGFIKHLQYKGAKGGKYTIKAPKPYSAWTTAEKKSAEEAKNSETKFEAPTKTYILEIDSVLLHLYYTGVGVLSFHLNNRLGPEAKEADQSTPDDILYINQYGRRIFAPFYNIAPEKTGYQEVFDEDDFTGPEGRPHGKELAHEISISIPGHKKVYSEKWERKPSPDRHKDGSFTFPLAGFIEPFLGLLYKEHKIQPVLDDRMFTLCWYGNNELVKKLKPDEIDEWVFSNRSTRKVVRESIESDIDRARNEFDWWYKFVFVDASMVTVQHPAMRRKLLEAAMYLRWSGCGTYYGVTDYSMMLLTSDLKTLREPNVNAHFMVTHLQTIYFRLAELVLVQRACVQRFSDEVTHVSRLEVTTLSKTSTTDELDKFDQDVKVLSQDANMLYRHYIRFVNRVYFREVTAQVQGIELYEKLQQQARLPQLVDGLSEEVHELHNYVRQETDRQLVVVEKKRKDQEQERWNMLTLFGSVLIVPGLIIAAFDLNFFAPCFREASSVSPFGYTLLVAAFAGYLTHGLFTNFSKSMAWQTALILIVLMVLPWLICVFATT